MAKENDFNLGYSLDNFYLDLNSSKDSTAPYRKRQRKQSQGPQTEELKAESKTKDKKLTKHTEGYILGEGEIEFSGLELKLTLPLSAGHQDKHYNYQKKRQQIIDDAENLADKYKFDVYILAFLDNPLISSIILHGREVVAGVKPYYERDASDFYLANGNVLSAETTHVEVVRDASINKLVFAIASFYNRAGNKTPIKKR